ncbi:hypothetical protein [Paraconexibacter algicola]|uniref:hypothetical protein n=1 Tax=Paraconexibacter algicola TaxID=2133960 RepID=UPI001304E8E1|nr:hypothetical protein [Paraconexibacter algicola]
MRVTGRLTLVFASPQEMSDAVASAVESPHFTLVEVDESALRVVVDVDQGE